MSGFGGKTKTSGQGRPAGIPNKITRDLKEMILGALDDAGGQKYLALQAKANPGAFLTLVGKVLPNKITGPGGDDPVKVSLTVEEEVAAARATIATAFAEVAKERGVEER